MDFQLAVLIITALVIEGGCKSTPEFPAGPCSSRCPGVHIVGNLSDSSVRKSFEGNIVNGVWGSGALDTSSPLVSELRDVLLEMAASESVHFSRVAFMHAAWAVALLAEAELYPSFCDLAKVINESINYEKNKDPKTYIDVVYILRDSVGVACAGVGHATMAEIGCPDLPPVQNGLVFCASEAFQLFGRLIPWTLADVFFRLYYSAVFLERAHATILAFILTPGQYKLFTQETPSLQFEGLQMFVESSGLSQCCCECRRVRIDELCFLGNKTAYENAAGEIASALGQERLCGA